MILNTNGNDTSAKRRPSDKDYTRYLYKCENPSQNNNNEPNSNQKQDCTSQTPKASKLAYCLIKASEMIVIVPD